MQSKRRKRLAASSVGLGAAALLGLGAPACDRVPVGKADDSSRPTPAAQAGEDDSSAKLADDAGDPSAPVDCRARENKFSPACGYPSPTKYAALDPRRIVNA